MLEKRQVVMLPSKKANPNLFLHQGIGQSLKILASGQGIAHHREMMECGVSKPQHLYFTSDEEIKVGDWFITELITNPSNICRYIKEDPNPNDLSEYGYCKIVATTNLDLCKDGVAKIGLDFVEAYIKAYNKGKPINEVMLEYVPEFIGWTDKNDITSTMPNLNNESEEELKEKCDVISKSYKIRLRKDNTVIIHPVKPKLYTEKEVKDYLIKLGKKCSLNFPEYNGNTNLTEFIEWWWEQNK